MAMAKETMRDKVKSAYNARTGKTMTESDLDALIDLCQGIIEELLANAVVTVTGVTAGGASATGSITA
jgi:hypothetical protein